MAATFEQLMNAAAKAKGAGAENDARTLFNEAKRLYPDRFPKQAGQQASVTPTAPVQAAPDVVVPPNAETFIGGSQYKAPTPTPHNVGDVFFSTVEDPAAATAAFAKGAMGTGPSPSKAYLTNQGIHPAIVAALAPLGDVGMTALAALGTGIAGVAGTAGELMPGTPTQKQKFANDLQAMSDVAVPELAGVSGTVTAAGKAARIAARAERPLPRRLAAQAAQDLGVTPSLGMTGRTGAMAAAAMEKMPGSGSVIGNDATRAVGEIAAAARAITGKIGTAASPASAGSVLQSGLGAFVDRFKANAKRWYDAVPIAPGSKVQIPTTLKSAAESRKWFADNPELASKLGLTGFDKVFAEAEANGMTWQALKDFRSKIGEAMSSIKGPMADHGEGNLKDLYATLTTDMEAAAKAAGPEAYAAWTSANAKYKAGAERIQTQLDSTINAKSPERAFEAFDRMTSQDSASSDIMRVRKIKASLKPGEWNTISASIVDRMGKAAPGAQGAEGGAFSPGTFLTNWNKMSDEAKKLLVPEDVRIELTRLARVAESAKKANAERNFSNTGTVGAWTALLYAGPTNAAGALAGSYLSSKAFTSATFLNAVNNFIAGNRTALAAMANGKGAFAQDAKTILRMAAQDAAQGGNAANSAERPNLAIQR